MEPSSRGILSPPLDDEQLDMLEDLVEMYDAEMDEVIAALRVDEGKAQRFAAAHGVARFGHPPRTAVPVRNAGRWL